MATYNTYECQSCGLKYTDSGPHLFYRTLDGKIERVPHPSPGIIEFEISGIINNDYCMDCKTERRFITENGKGGKSELEYLVNQLNDSPKKNQLPHCEICGGFSSYNLNFDSEMPWRKSKEKLYECPQCGEKQLKCIFYCFT